MSSVVLLGAPEASEPLVRSFFSLLGKVSFVSPAPRAPWGAWTVGLADPDLAADLVRAGAVLYGGRERRVVSELEFLGLQRGGERAGPAAPGALPGEPRPRALKSPRRPRAREPCSVARFGPPGAGEGRPEARTAASGRVPARLGAEDVARVFGEFGEVLRVLVRDPADAPLHGQAGAPSRAPATHSLVLVEYASPDALGLLLAAPAVTVGGVEITWRASERGIDWHAGPGAGPGGSSDSDSDAGAGAGAGTDTAAGTAAAE